MSKTMMQVNRDRAGRHDDLVASGSAVELRYRDGKSALSLRAGKMLHLLVKAANGALGEHIKHTIRLSELKDVSHLNSKDIEEIAHELAGTTIEVRVSRPIPAVIVGSILDYAKIELIDRGVLLFRFSEPMVSVFNADDRWTILSRKIVMAFESRYALRLFEMLSLRQSLKRRAETFDLSDLRARLGVEKDKLSKFSHFRLKCLDPAVEEIKRVMGMDVNYERVLSGQTVKAITLSWSDPMSTPTTHETPARRRGRPAGVSTARAAKTTKNAANVEATSVAAAADHAPAHKAKAFPAKGGISYSAWGQLSREHAPGWDPDLIAAAFRDFAVKKSIPLNATEIEKTFVGFCKTKVRAK